MRCRIGSLGLKVLVLVFTLVLGVSLTRIVRNTHHQRKHCSLSAGVISGRVDYASLPRVTFCELMAAPESYEGKLLLLPVKPHEPGIIGKAELCSKGDPKFDIDFVGYGFRDSGAEEFWSGGEMTLFGKFSKRPFAGDSSKYQFQVFQIYEARLFVAPQ